MPKFIYANPIIPGKAQVLRYVYRQKRENPQLVHDEVSFRQALGLEECQSWLQKTQRGDFFIHYLETSGLEVFFNNLQSLIKQEHPKALWLRDFLLEVLGRDYNDLSAIPRLVQLFELTLTDPIPMRGEIISQGYLFPLLPKKLDAYREFCRQISGEHKARIEEACRHLHISKMSAFLQSAIGHDYIVIYREKVLLPQEQATRPHEVRASSPAYQWISNQLMELTGLTFDQLEPNIEYLSPQPLVSFHQRPFSQPAMR